MNKSQEIEQDIKNREKELAREIRDLLRCLQSEESTEIKDAIIDIRMDSMIKKVRTIQVRGRAMEKIASVNVREIISNSKLLRDQNTSLMRKLKEREEAEFQSNSYKRAFKDVLCDHIGTEKYAELARYASTIASSSTSI